MSRYAKYLLTIALSINSGLAFSQNYDEGYNSDCCRSDCCSFLDNLSVRGEVLVWKTTETGSKWGQQTVDTDTSGTVSGVSIN